jgi:hypothetical protein
MINQLIPKFTSHAQRDDFWLQVCKEFIASGLSKTTFCAKRKISDSSLYRWLGHFKDNPGLVKSPRKLTLGKKAPVKHNFLRVNVEQQVAAQNNSPLSISKLNQPSVELVFANGMKLIIHTVG